MSYGSESNKTFYLIVVSHLKSFIYDIHRQNVSFERTWKRTGAETMRMNMRGGGEQRIILRQEKNNTGCIMREWNENCLVGEDALGEHNEVDDDFVGSQR